MKRLDTIQSKIKNDLKKVMQDLNLPEIRVYFNHDSRIFFRSQKSGSYMSIHIDSTELLWKMTKKGLNHITHKNYNLDSVQKRYYHILYHEIGHYIQKYKHGAWFKKYRDIKQSSLYNESGYSITPKEYRKLKLEHNADNLGIAIYNKIHGGCKDENQSQNN